MNKHRKMKTVRMFCIMVGSVLAAFLVPLAARAWLASPRPVEAPVMAAIWPSKVTQISQNEYPDSMQFYPALAVVSPTVCVAWSQQVGNDPEYYDPYYRRSDGSTWGGRFNIHSTSPTKETTRVDVAIDNSHKLHFVWNEYTKTPYTYTLYYFYTGASVETITEWNGDPGTSAIAVSNNDVHVAWSQWSSIRYASKPIGSGSWSIDNLASASMAIQPDLAVTGAGTAHVVWSEGAGDASADIFYKNSSNWSTTFEVSGDASNGGRSPAIAVSGSNVYVVWCEYVSRSEQYIRFRRSWNGGSTWGLSVRISGRFAANQDSPTYLRPAIAVDSNGEIHVAFNGTGAVSDPENIYYASKIPGESWQCCRNLTYNIDGNNTTPDIAASDGDVHLIWAGPPGPFDLQGNDYEVLYKRTIVLGEGGIYLPIIMKSAS